MSSRRINSTRMTSETASQSAISEVNFHQDSSRTDGFTPENVLAALINDLNNLFEEVSACEAEFNHVSKRSNPVGSKSHEESSFSSGDYREILNLKANLIEQITTQVELMNSSPDIPKAKVHCYQKYVSLLQQKLENSQQKIDKLCEDMRKTKLEYKRVEQQVETFKKLKEDEETANEGYEIKQLFTEAKNDLNYLLRQLYPVNVKEEFSQTMAKLTDGFIKNNNEEDQYVELSPEILQNRGIMCLIKSHFIIEHPSNPLRYRVNMAE